MWKCVYKCTYIYVFILKLGALSNNTYLILRICILRLFWIKGDSKNQSNNTFALPLSTLHLKLRIYLSGQLGAGRQVILHESRMFLHIVCPEAVSVFSPRPTFQGCLYSESPWKIEIVFLSGAKGKFVALQYNKGCICL